MNLKKLSMTAILVFLSGFVWAADADKSEDTMGDVTEFEAHWFVPMNEDEQESNNFILQGLAKGLKEPLGMGWLIPPNTVITNKKYEKVFVYSDSEQGQKGSFSKSLDQTEAQKVRQQYGMACGSTDSYFQYDLGGSEIKTAIRAVVSEEVIPDAQLSFQKVELTSKELEPLFKALGGRQNFTHQYVAIRTSDGAFTYSFHALYDPKKKVLRKSGVILQGKDGEVIGKSVEQFDAAQACKNCGIPTSDDPLSKIYSPINLIQTSLFTYPLVVLDAGDANGKGISLLTFDPKGAKSEVRAYETGCDQTK
jgi:hypothetical protein